MVFFHTSNCKPLSSPYSYRARTIHYKSYAFVTDLKHHCITIDGILTFMSMIHFVLSYVEHEKSCYNFGASTQLITDNKFS